MKTRGLIVLLLLVFSGCAQKTVHEYCTEFGSRYRDYDQCYSEELALRKSASETPTRAAAFFQGFSNGFNGSHPVSCSSINYGYQVQTTCR